MRHFTYIAAVWQWDLAERSYVRRSPIYRMGRNLDHAKERARDMLPVRFVEGTEWTADRELARAPRVIIERRETRRTTSGRLVHMVMGRYISVEPEVRIVPSVGQLGWTP